MFHRSATQAADTKDDKNRGAAAAEDDENKDDADGTKRLETTIAMGPSFYEKDIQSW